MKEEIAKVLSDETLTTNEERVEAITKALGPLTMPKDKFNEVNNELKMVKSNYETLSIEFDEFKQSKMTEEDRAKAEAEKFENEKKDIARTKSELAVQKLLLKNGIEISDDDVELSETLQNIVSEDYDKSIKLANNFINLLNKTIEDTQKQTVTDLLNGTPKPAVGNPNTDKISNLDALQADYDKAIQSKDVVAQARLMRLIQEEQSKQKV